MACGRFCASGLGKSKDSGFRGGAPPNGGHYNAPHMAALNLLAFGLAAVLEIAGCFAFWAWLRRDASAWWVVAGIVSLVAFAATLTRVETAFAGRAYAAYGGIYIAASLMWLWRVEGQRPTTTDQIGAAIAIAGALVILLGARQTS